MNLLGKICYFITKKADQYQRKKLENRFKHVKIGKDVIITGDVKIKAGVIIHNFVTIIATEPAKIFIGKDTFINARTEIRTESRHADRKLVNKDIFIGRNVLIGPNCYLCGSLDIFDHSTIGVNSYLYAKSIKGVFHNGRKENESSNIISSS